MRLLMSSFKKKKIKNKKNNIQMITIGRQKKTQREKKLFCTLITVTNPTICQYNSSLFYHIKID